MPSLSNGHDQSANGDGPSNGTASNSIHEINSTDNTKTITDPNSHTTHTINHTKHPPIQRLYPSSSPPDLTTLRTLCARTTTLTDYPLATTIISKIPIYDLSHPNLSSPTTLSTLQDEWYTALLTGPGVLILRNFLPSSSTITTTNSVFDSIIAAEATSSVGKKGDHFAASGRNSRVWNSLGKHCLHHPSSFIAYYSNPWLHRISSAYLGPAYRVTAQANIVHPGGQPQVPHRDYHFGFMSRDQCAKYPRALQVASQMLTLQGAVAQCDMNLESGPTRFLPYSQLLESGYMDYHHSDMIDYFRDNWVSAELKRGDAVFFNPAIIHAAGENKTGGEGTEGVMRSANLLQISAAFGKTMETIDAIPLVKSCWEEVLQEFGGQQRSEDKRQEEHNREDTDANAEDALEALICSLAEGYPFPTNLDNRPPGPGGMAPDSEQDVLRRALREGWGVDEVVRVLEGMRRDSLA